MNRTFIAAFLVLCMVFAGAVGLVLGRPVHAILLGALAAISWIAGSIALNALFGTSFFKDK